MFPYPIMLQILALLLLIADLSGCASAQRVCNRTSANELGRSDARRWDSRRSNLQRGRACTDKYSTADFQQDYGAGFRQALTGQCTPDGAAAAGQQAASADKQWQLDSSGLQLCAEVGAAVADLRRSYDQAYVATWCSTVHAQQLAQQHAAKLQPVAFDWLTSCPADGQQALNASYRAQYDQTIAAACSSPAMASWGITLAREQGDLAPALAAISNCPSGLQREAVASLQRSYDGEAQRLAQQRAEQQHQQEQARHEQEHAQREEQHRVAASRREYVIEGKRVTLTCSVEDGRALVQLFNNDREYLSATGYITVESYDASGRPVDATRTSAVFSAAPGAIDDETVRVPRQAVGCLVSSVEFH